MASAMDVDDDEIELPTSSSSKGEKKRFEVKKVSKV
jgi:RING-box protein 1